MVKKAKLFHAHKRALADASDVFKTMFFGSVPQDNPVVVNDTSPAAFEAFLRFIYTGTTTITEEDVFPLLYLGKKYLVGSLVKVVMNHLEGCLTSENVSQIVLSGQNFLDDVTPKLWKHVESHADALLTSDEFMQLRKDAVSTLVQRDLQVEEKFVYDRVVAWARVECARNQRPTEGETLRRALEGILQHVRFPTMTAEQFARGPANEAVLTAEVLTHRDRHEDPVPNPVPVEKHGEDSSFDVVRGIHSAVPVSDTPRFAEGSYVCERIVNWSGLRTSGGVEAIDFSVSREARVTGLGAFGFYMDGSKTDRNYSIIAKLALGSVELATKELTGTISQALYIVPVTFDKPIKIDAAQRYTASVVVTGPDTYCGVYGRPSMTVSTRKGDVVFDFMDSALCLYTSVYCGQIPRIFFRI